MHPEENFYSSWKELPAPSKTHSKMQPFVPRKKVMMAVFLPSALYMQWVSLHDTERPFTFVIGVSFLFSLYTFMIWAHCVRKRSKLIHKINFYAPFLFHLNLQNKGPMGFNCCLWQVLPLCNSQLSPSSPEKKPVNHGQDAAQSSQLNLFSCLNIPWLRISSPANMNPYIFSKVNTTLLITLLRI